VYGASASRRLDADVIVMATARTSENELYQLLRERRLSVEAVGCAVAPRTVYEATLEGHRAARKLSGGRLRWVGTEVATIWSVNTVVPSCSSRSKLGP
jgi:hypothetical protein